MTSQPDGPRTSNDLSDLVEAAVSRRAVLAGGLATAVGTFLIGGGGSRGALLGGSPAGAQEAGEGLDAPSAGLLGFTPVAVSQADGVAVPPGYVAQVFYRWGDPVRPNGPKFKPNANNTAAEQEQQAGTGHDGMHYFPLPPQGGRNQRGLLVVNHEYAESFLLFSDGEANWTHEKTLKSQAAHGVSVIAIEYFNGGWNRIRSPYARRITARTPMTVSGPAAGHPLMQTSADPSGAAVLGTVNNCANGATPWNTYVTCEENFNAYFGTSTPSPTITPLMAAYGVNANGFGPDWWATDPRFDIVAEPNESNRFGWIVEIDPFDPASTPVKRTALGRFKHENACFTETADGRVVVYSGDDERGQFVYKFVSTRPWVDAVADGESPLDDGILYVARFSDDATAGDGMGVGEWLPLVHGVAPLDGANGFTDQGDVLVRTRMAGAALGATRMDRPEWITIDPATGQVYCAMTNNSQRGTVFPADEANPRGPNPWGHIIRWAEAGGDPAAMTFTWDLFVLAGDPAQAHGATPGIDAFGSPDGIAFDPDGRLWIETDGSQPVPCNNQLLVADPSTAEVRRFLVGPKGAEVTGISWTPDQRVMFVNMQHPGENGTAANPRAESNWPDFDPVGRPRDATVAIWRNDRGVIGT